MHAMHTMRSHQLGMMRMGMILPKEMMLPWSRPENRTQHETAVRRRCALSLGGFKSKRTVVKEKRYLPAFLALAHLSAACALTDVAFTCVGEETLHERIGP